jgi:multidrug efflux pump
MTITLAAVYAPIGFVGGLTGALFKEFAFTLAGSVIISGVIALTLSPVMCSMMLTNTMAQGRFARIVDRVFSGLTAWYGRWLKGSLDYRPVTVMFAVCILGSIYFLYTNTRAELAPVEDQGVLFGILKMPQYANIAYDEAYGVQLDTKSLVGEGCPIFQTVNLTAEMYGNYMQDPLLIRVRRLGRPRANSALI